MSNAANDPATVRSIAASEPEPDRFERLALACARRDLATVKSELRPGDPVVMTGASDRPSLMHFAAIGGDTNILEMLVEFGAYLGARMTASLTADVPEGPKTPLDLARLLQKTDAIAFLEKACDKAGLDGETHTVKIMRYPDGGRFVAVHNAYTGERVHRTMADRFRKRIADGDGPWDNPGDLDAIGAIVAAVETNDNEQLKRVIDGYPQDEQIIVDRGGNTVLHLAAIRGNIDTVTTLLSKGADPFRRNRWGQRAIDVLPEQDLGARLTENFLAFVMGDDRPFTNDDGTVKEKMQELYHRRAMRAGIRLDKLAQLKAQYEEAGGKDRTGNPT